MDRRRVGLLLTSVALIVYLLVLPLLPKAGLAADAAHLTMGLVLGLGLVMMLSALYRKRTGVRCASR
jgi:uncharacterized membrane protein